MKESLHAIDIFGYAYQIGKHGHKPPAHKRGADAEHNQDWHKHHECHYLGQYKVIDRINAHNVKSINLLRNPHRAYFRSDVRPYFPRQNQAENRIGKFQQNDIAGSKTDRISRNQRGGDIKLHLYGNHRADKQRDDDDERDGINAQVYDFHNRATKRNPPFIGYCKRPFQEQAVFAKLPERVGYNHC